MELHSNHSPTRHKTKLQQTQERKVLKMRDKLGGTSTAGTVEVVISNRVESQC
jgi:hypothetical protein